MGNDNIIIPVRMNISLRFQGGMPQAKPQYVSLARKSVSVAFARHPESLFRPPGAFLRFQEAETQCKFKQEVPY